MVTFKEKYQIPFLKKAKILIFIPSGLRQLKISLNVETCHLSHP
jgi:hypothetical protein